MARKRWVKHTGTALALIAQALVASAEAKKRTAVHEQVCLTDIDRMTGREFELFLTDLFRRLGFTATHRGKRGDAGADVTLEQSMGVTVVQAKCYDWNRKKHKVDQAAVTEVLASKPVYGAHSALVVTNSYFTPGAQRMARIHNVGLWDRNVLARKLAQAARRGKNAPAQYGSRGLDAFSVVLLLLLLISVYLAGLLASAW